MGVILTCNAGSSNVKLAALDTRTLEVRAHSVMQNNPASVEEWLCSVGSLGVDGIVHRVVHGGRRYYQPTPISAELVDYLKTLVCLAPLHQPATLSLIRETERLYPKVPQTACFDTAFHHELPELEKRLPIPERFYDQGVMRYGFHGLSYQHVAETLPSLADEQAKGRVIVLHLGGGASICAMKNLQSVGTSMGFSTLDGLMMGSRCGSLDPGALLYMLKQERMSIAGVEALLYHSCGLLGVSGISESMEVLEQSSDARAKTAIELFVHIAIRQIGSLVALLGGLDALVFTGGIGQHSSHVRSMIVDQLQWLNVHLVHERNLRHAPCISEPNSPVGVYIIPADEERVMAEAWQSGHLGRTSSVA